MLRNYNRKSSLYNYIEPLSSICRLHSIRLTFIKFTKNKSIPIASYCYTPHPTPLQRPTSSKQIFPYPTILFTLPTCPSSNITFIPCEWLELFVSIFITTPRVSCPELWSAFSTISTLAPTSISARFCPFIFSPSII